MELAAYLLRLVLNTTPHKGTNSLSIIDKEHMLFPTELYPLFPDDASEGALGD
jgi:hypothetical protein